ncbi:threonine dehydratase [Bradyrhizobium sp. USDA 10063]
MSDMIWTGYERSSQRKGRLDGQPISGAIERCVLPANAPTGGGTGLIGMWKAFDELEAIGFIGPKRPKMVAVQASGCAPIVRAFDGGAESAQRWENAQTIAAGIRVPQAIGDFLILRALRESNGYAIAIEDREIEAALLEVATEEGLLLCPEGAATYAAYKRSLAEARVSTPIGSSSSIAHQDTSTRCRLRCAPSIGTSTSITLVLQPEPQPTDRC